MPRAHKPAPASFDGVPVAVPIGHVNCGRNGCAGKVVVKLARARYPQGRGCCETCDARFLLDRAETAIVMDAYRANVNPAELEPQIDLEDALAEIDAAEDREDKDDDEKSFYFF